MGMPSSCPNYARKTAASRRNQWQRPSEGCLFQGYLGFQTRVLGLIRSAVGCFREVAKDWWRCEKRTEVWVVKLFFYPDFFWSFTTWFSVGRWTRNWVLFFFMYVFKRFFTPLFSYWGKMSSHFATTFSRRFGPSGWYQGLPGKVACAVSCW